MKKTITLTDDQVVAVGVAIGTQGAISIYEKDIAALEQVKEKIRRAKWKY